MSILGNRVLRTEDPKFLTVGGSYVYDLGLENAAQVTYVRSTMAHARITEVDLTDARSSPGVLGVFSAEDIDLAPREPEMAGMINAAMSRPWLADGVVRFVGEPVVAIVSETRAQGADAAEVVFIDYEPLPVIVDPEASAESETILFPSAGTNVAVELSFGRDENLFDGCDVVVSQRIVNQRVAPCPLEVRSAASRWEPDGRLTHWASTQAPHGVKDTLERVLGLESGQVHVIAPDVGGGFGAKVGLYPEELLVAWLARKVGRPLMWTETRSESMVGLGHGRGQTQFVEMGGSRDGRITAYRLTIVQDAGAYPAMGSILPFISRVMVTGTYDIPKAELNARSLATNTTPLVAYRGAGRPEATAALERVMDIYSAEIGMDPTELRRRNLISKDAFPYTTPVGTVYDTGDYQKALDLALEAAGYPQLREDQARRRQRGDVHQLGIGVSVYVEITNPVGGSEFGKVEVRHDGTAVVKTGTSPHGQGHATSWAMLVSEKTGIPIENIDVVHGDTDQVPKGLGTMGSRSLQAGGVAVNQAATQLVELARRKAADLLEANPADVVLDTVGQRFHVAGTPAINRSWSDVAHESGGGIAAEVDFPSPGPTFPFGSHIAVVDVDIETGKVTLERLVAVDDAGTVINPLLVEGQVHGGLAQGAAQALLEEVRYDEDGNPITSNLADYAFVSAPELPNFESIRMQTPTPINELGAKGIGESGTIGSTPAVQNAVVDALSHLGVRHIDMPTTPEKVWRAIREAAERESA